MMTPRDTIEAAAALMYGGEWQSPLARDLGVAVRTVQRWARGDSPVPARVPAEIAAIASGWASGVSDQPRRIQLQEAARIAGSR